MSDNNGSIIQYIKSKLTVRKILATLVITVLILFPTVLAIANAIHSDSSAKESARTSQVALLDAVGTELYREDADQTQAGDTSLVSIFNAIYKNMLSIDALPASVDVSTPLTAVIYNGTENIRLTCFFSFTENSSYCVDSSGAAYKILSEDSERFLASPFAEILYRNASLGALMSNEGDEILPISTSWYYQNIDGAYLEAQKNKTESQKRTFSMMGELTFDFEKAPDSCNVVIHNDQGQIFNGSPEDLGTLLLDSNTPLDVTLTATWEYTDGCLSYGTATYSFEAIIHNRAEFAIDTSRLSVGDFAIVSATNVTELSKLKFTSQDTDFQPSFKLIDSTAYAIIPFSALREGDTTLEFSVSYGVSSQSFKIDYDPSDVTYKHLCDSASAFGFDLGNGPGSSLEYSFVGAQIVAPSSQSFSESLEYATLVYYNGKYAYSCTTEYSCDQGYGENVYSMTSGKVIYTGENTQLGKYAVVDMGMGLRIWYCNLSFVDVSVGHFVSTGDVLGKTGTLSYGQCEGFSVLLCYNNIPLNVNSLLDKFYAS